MIQPDILNKLPSAFNPKAAEGINCTIHFVTSGSAYVEIKDGACTLTEGTPASADLTVTISDDNLIALLTGKLHPATGLVLRKFKTEGNIALGPRIRTFFDPAQLRE